MPEINASILTALFATKKNRFGFKSNRTFLKIGTLKIFRNTTYICTGLGGRQNESRHNIKHLKSLNKTVKETV